ncbi:hypothetical protein G6046_03345 [Bacillus amyloliquefaciens]|nr:hypothetical protein [Bacillus amyloliquefaciens]
MNLQIHSNAKIEEFDKFSFSKSNFVKQREKRSKDLTQVKCIKDENQKVLFLEKDIQHRWVSYFDKLFNEDSENTIDLSDLNIVHNNKTFHFCRRVSKKEVEEA